MAGIPVPTAQDRNGRQLILEGLWMIGIPPELFAGIDPANAGFLEELHKRGLTDEFINRAAQGVAWRPPDDNSPLSQRIADLLRASGYRQDEIERFAGQARLYGGQVGDDPKGLLRVLTEQFGDRTAGAMMMKATGGKPPDGAAWNPYRTDVPPKNVDTRYGGGGIPAMNYRQDPLAGPSGGIGGQQAELPTPPTPVQQKQQAAATTTTTPPADKTTTPLIPGSTAGTVKDKLTPKFIPHGEKEITDFIKQHFGADAWWIDIPEVHDILYGMAAEGNTDGTEASRRVKTTEWWHNTSFTARNWEAKRKEDPGTILSDIAEQASFLQKQAAGLGIDIGPERLSALAESSLRFGWSASQISTALGAEFHYDPSSQHQAVAVSTMKQVAGQYMVPLSDQTINDWATGLIQGVYTDDQFKEYVKGMAKSMFPQLSTAIDSGHTVESFVSPYREMAARTLEIAPNAIDFMDGKWRKAIDQVDPKTGVKQVMSLTDWEDEIKTNPLYKYDQTNQSINEAAGLANHILKTFGAIK